MQWTPEQVVNVITSVSGLVTAGGVIVLAYFQYRLKMRLRENTEVLAGATQAVVQTSAQVEQVHACLSDARTETTTAIADAKATAQETAAIVSRLEESTNNKMDQLLTAQVGKDENSFVQNSGVN